MNFYEIGNRHINFDYIAAVEIDRFSTLGDDGKPIVSQINLILPTGMELIFTSTEEKNRIIDILKLISSKQVKS